MATKKDQVDELDTAGGILEADVGAIFDKQLAAIAPGQSRDVDSRAHQTLRPEQMFIRDELRQAKMQTLAVRRVALRKQLLNDFIQEDRDLRKIGLAYARPGP